MTSDEKTCPRCAETVKAAAAACRFCNYEFVESPPGGSAMPSAPRVTNPPAKPPRKMMSGCAVVAICGAALVILLLLIPTPDAPPPATSDPKNVGALPPETRVTAVDLARAYAANEARAQATYGDKPLAVTGTVEGVDLDLFNKPIVKLVADNPFMPVQAAVVEEDQAMTTSLNKGDKVELWCGRVGEVIGTPMLRDCRITSP